MPAEKKENLQRAVFGGKPRKADPGQIVWVRGKYP